ncbi:MAG: hypothetical protein M3256_21060 [Actinomycetota bacterium]|nr:hypothetical protein [Actinomycetota bacterium]
MSQTVNCPLGDGICTIPDPSIVAIASQFSLVSAEALRRLLPETAHKDRLEIVQELDVDYPQLVEHLTSALNYRAQSQSRPLASVAAGPGDDDDDLPEEGYIAREGFDQTAILSLAVRGGGRLSDGVVVTCSCAHTWIAR